MRTSSEHPGVSIEPQADGSAIARYREWSDGKRCSREKTFPDYQQAHAFAIIMSAKLGITALAPGLGGDLVKPPGRLDMLIPKFVAERTAKGKKTSLHAKNLGCDIRRCQRWFGWETTLDIDDNAIGRVVAKYQASDSRQGHFTVVGSIRNFLNWAKKKHFVHQSAFDFEVTRSPAEERVVWSVEETVKIYLHLCKPLPDGFHAAPPLRRGTAEWRKRVQLSTSADNRRALAELFRIEALWAMRPGEASAMTVSMWKPREREIHLPPSVPKTQRPRKIPVDKRTAKILEDRCRGRKPDDPIFVTKSGCAWTTRRQNRVLKPVLVELGLGGSLYSTRSFATTRMLEDPHVRNFKSVMAVTGHSTLSEFYKYLRGHLQEIKDAADGGYADIFTNDIQHGEGREDGQAKERGMAIEHKGALIPDDHACYAAIDGEITEPQLR